MERLNLDYERAVARHKDSVYRQMVRLCGDHDDAEDVLVEALVAAYKARETIRDEGAFQAWLATTARRVCFRLRRHESLRPLLYKLEDADAVTAANTIQEEVEAREVKQCVQQAVESLAPEYRDVYLLRDIEGLSGPEVSRKLGISVAAMKSRLHRSRKEVRALLDQSICAQR